MRKTFKELVNSGEWDQKRYDYFANKYAFHLVTPIRKQLERAMPRNNLLDVSLIQIIAGDIIKEFIMELYFDTSLASDSKRINADDLPPINDEVALSKRLDATRDKRDGSFYKHSSRRTENAAI